MNTELYLIDHILYYFMLALVVCSVYGCATDGDPARAPAFSSEIIEWDNMRDGIFYVH